VICATFIAFKGGEWLVPKPSRRYIFPCLLCFDDIFAGIPAMTIYSRRALPSLLFYLWPMLVLVIISVQNRQFPAFDGIAIFAAAFVVSVWCWSPQS
jgi:hypothetical protein